MNQLESCYTLTKYLLRTHMWAGYTAEVPGLGWKRKVRSKKQGF